jgi:glutathione synthase/RimK-type ligase-like ATP-grasp enzyme
MYTKYIKKRDEYRVHVVQGNVIDTQIKMRRYDTDDNQVNWMLRNHSNGFIFGRDRVVHDARRDALAIAAVHAVNLDFGGVDIIWNAYRNEYYVLEVNTAPGITGTTLQNYVTAFNSI